MCVCVVGGGGGAACGTVIPHNYTCFGNASRADEVAF